MSQNRREMQVGLAVILSATVLIAGTLWFKNFRFAGGVVRYAVDFPAVEGLQVRDRVQVRGIRMGAVDGFVIVADQVRVTFHIDKGMSLHEDARIQLTTVGIVGEMIVEIDPGSGKPVPEGHVFQGQVAVSLPAITEAISSALTDLRALSAEIQGLVAEVRAEDRLPSAVDAAGSAARNLDELVRENREGLQKLVTNFEATSVALRSALAGPDSNLARTADAAARTVTRADSVLARIDHTSVLLHEVVSRLERGEGTAGHLLADETLYLRADSTLTTLSRLLSDLRRNPKKYFKFNVIDF
jgi:phospholipid/cholesterol/gamma-HCH transport system substrate-binding protein